MRTTTLRRLAGGALRTRTAHVATAAVVSAGLVFGALTVAKSATADSPTTSWKRTSQDLLHTPYFENRATPWVASHLTRQRLDSKAPQGRIVARVGNRNNRVAIDDWPGEVTTTAGYRYRASIHVAAVN